MNIKLLFCFAVYLNTSNYAQTPTKVTVKTLNQSQAFTCITADDKGNVWAGTKANGLWRGFVSNNNLKELTNYSLVPNINKLNLQTLAVSSNRNGTQTVWIGHSGFGSVSTAASGGIDYFVVSDTKLEHLMPEIYKKTEASKKISADKKNGIPSRNCKALAVDKYNNIWSAHAYHDLTVTSTGIIVYDPLTHLPTFPDLGGYYVTPGGLARQVGNKLFDNVSMNQMPFPAYTINTPSTKTAGTRQCVSVACGEEEVWMGFGGYEIDGGGYRSNGIARYNYQGKLIGYYDISTAPELPFTSTGGPRAIALHFQKNGNGWVGFGGKGFAILEKSPSNNTKWWTYVDKLNYYNKTTSANETSKLLPNGIPFNADAPGIITSDGQKVFIGTTNGILIYKGNGDFKQDSSYVLITTNDGLSSNNITGLFYKSGYLYAATSNGINQVHLPSDIEVYHIEKKEDPFNNPDEENYIQIAGLNDQTQNTNKASDTDLPMIACDGTTSTVFRYYTGDFDKFYDNKYKYGVNNDYDNTDTAKNGKLILKPRNYYVDQHPSYVDFIYRHPTFVDPLFVKEGKEIKFTFIIYDKAVNITKPAFSHELKFVLPPVLLIHGIWSHIGSFEEMEKYFVTDVKLKDFQVLRIYRDKQKDDELPAEVPFDQDVPIVSYGIKELIKNCGKNKMSAGKVNIIGHSRGGVYTRAYAEEIVPGLKFNNDINSLITLNTPHAGSQLPNLVLDKRRIKVKINVYLTETSTTPSTYTIVDKELGSFLELAIPKNDKIKKQAAIDLQVDKGFIITLNEPNNLDKFKNKKIPVHAFATNFSACKLKVTLCNPLVDATNPLDMPPAFKGIVILGKLAAYTIAVSVDGLMKNIFNGEESDFIVPKSSMEGGLGTKYISSMDGINIAHTNNFADFGTKGITYSKEVYNSIFDLYTQNVNSLTGNFTLDGYKPKSISYNFLPNFKGIASSYNKTTDTTDFSKIELFILRGSQNMAIKTGDSIQSKIYTKGLNKIVVVYEKEKMPEKSYIQTKTITKDDTSHFKFFIPDEFFDKMNMEVYGFKDSTLVAYDSYKLNIGLRDSTIKLTNILLNKHGETAILNKSTYTFPIQGMYSDSIVRDISNLSGFKFYIRDTTIISYLKDATVQANKAGSTQFIAVYNGLSDSVRVIVENPIFHQTILSNFEGKLKNNTVALNWATNQEYNNKYFTVERSNNNLTFDSIGTVKGNNTIYNELSNYSFVDNLLIPSKLYYRLKWKQGDGSYKYSPIIEINNSSSNVFIANDKANNNFVLYPNPAKNEVFLHFNNRVNVLYFTLYNNVGQALRQGKIVDTQDFRIDVLSMPAGIYFIKLSNETEELTHRKLILIKD